MSELYHIGNENSGRYPRGSGKNPRSERGKKTSSSNTTIKKSVYFNRFINKQAKQTEEQIYAKNKGYSENKLLKSDGIICLEKKAKLKNGEEVNFSIVSRPNDTHPTKIGIDAAEKEVYNKIDSWYKDAKKEVLLDKFVKNENLIDPDIEAILDPKGNKLTEVEVMFTNKEDWHFPSATYSYKKKRWSRSYDG